nr:2235_t:CDS:2 [Entrophospora candida]
MVICAALVLEKKLHVIFMDEYEETLIIFVGIENNCDSSMYFGGSGKLYKAEYMDWVLLVVVYNYKEKQVGSRSYLGSETTIKSVNNNTSLFAFLPLPSELFTYYLSFSTLFDRFPCPTQFSSW